MEEKSLEYQEKNAKEYYRIKNDNCPICREVFEVPSSILVHQGVGVHLMCYISQPGTRGLIITK